MTFDDLEAEQEALDAVLSRLSPAAWLTPSAAPGWTVADVVLHLAQTEEAVVMNATGGANVTDWRSFGSDVDTAMAAMVDAQRAPATVVHDRWRAARVAALQTLRKADPSRPVPWVTGSLKPRTLATTRLAEHWAHALDITGPLGIDYPDTARLRHIAWLAHSTLPYAFRLAELPPPEVYCELTAPDGTTWQYGNPSAASSIRGPAGAFCRVGAQRLAPAGSGLRTSGPDADTALRLLRNYAA
ncbi:maleylpyruvate isomerase family mycothiol-dependent enzyme [Actinoplanes sp. NPDC049596]|uniref:maleylpyruvate isomerase family mycothiol-dependent enzyme n=1 Tax=unclassified Actinoplanes TaxID=2626549 RepID=UPI00343709B8